MNLDESAVPNYKWASERWPDASTLSQYQTAISECIAGKRHGLVEHVKSFIECLCITILGEFNSPMPSSDPSTTELLVAALKPLGLQNTRGASKLDKVLSAFNKLSDALSDMRNENGPVAHGKDAFTDALSADHARAFLFAGDAIVGVLLNALEGKEPNFLVTREPYERFKHLCERIDSSIGIDAEVDLDGPRPVLVVSLSSGSKDDAMKLRIEPSRLLYGLDRLAFVELLNETPSQARKVEEESPEFKPKTIPKPLKRSKSKKQPSATSEVTKYQGPLLRLKPSLEGFVVSEGLVRGKPKRMVNSLLASAEQNMGLDWQTRDSLQARMKVAFRRLLVRFGNSSAKSADGAKRLLAWFQIQTPKKALEKTS